MSTPPPEVAAAAPAVVSAEEYDRMTPAQRWDYARSHDQSQFIAPAAPSK